MNCPYCNKIVQETWSYCHHCNKPLITSIKDEDIDNSSQFFDDFEYDDLDPNSNGSESFNIDIIEDDSINSKILEIDQKLNRISTHSDPLGDLLLEKASLYYKKRDLSTSLKNLEIALDNFENEQNQTKIAITHNEIGLIKEELGFFDEAIYHFDNALAILEDLKDYHKIIQVYNNVGNAYFQIKDIEKSYSYYQKALELADREGMEYEEVKSSSNLVEILFVLKSFERIKRILKRNLKFFKQKNDIYGIITTLVKYGKLYFNLGETYFENAYENFEEALRLIDQIQDKISIYLKAKLEWEVFFLIGKINLIEDNDTKAEDYLLKSLESIRIFEIYQENIDEGKVLETLGHLYEYKGDSEKAMEYYRLAIEIYYKYGENDKIASLKTNIADIYLNDIRDETEALNYFEEAIEIYKKQNYIKELANLYNKIGDIYINKNLVNIAISNFENALEYYKEMQDTYHQELINEKIKSLVDSEIHGY
ncbi:MAG: tetratricopeptide repeat protein [Candidatus Lokiarchaeota archaeon]|nr:tetratricopeptide repeat protein [Candidatus Lokiarchaeota archaeon]MBD3200855.1 tetratricopeptide repeat protein [Candidatus Lokiarchaeota archaeon]